MKDHLELSNTQILRVLDLAPPGDSDPKAEAAAGAQLLEADREVYAA